MSAATPTVERLIPLREIPAELARLTRELEQLRIERDDYKQRAEAWAAVGKAPCLPADVDKTIRRLRTFVRDIQFEMDRETPDLKSIRDEFVHALDDYYIGKGCDECDCRGYVTDEAEVSDPSALHGYSTVRMLAECSECNGRGRVAR